MITTRRIRSLRTTVLASTWIVGSTLALAQAYGPGDQVMAIGAASFRQESGFFNYIDSLDGYLYNDAGDAAAYVAPVFLPDGALVTQICLYGKDTGHPLGPALAAQFEAVKLAPGGESPGIVVIPGTLLETTFTIGYGTVCTDSLSYVVHETADVDGDGIPEHVTHRIRASLFYGDVGAALGGVRIIWHRQVSPAPATATFNDVPTTHQFFKFIEALHASGITGGCQVSPPLYCPDNPVTRGQMAVFLATALGLHWPD
jgi:hypothetical protein